MESMKSVVNKYPESKRYSLKENELLAKEIEEVLEDDHSLGAFKTVVDKIPEQKIRIFLSIIKDTYLTGRIKNSRGAMFITLAKDYARKNNINLNFR
jgi:thymidylate synthase ThyX